MIKAGIIGATGYAGIETLRLLVSHPEFDVTCAVSKSFSGKKISDIYPSLKGVCDIICVDPDLSVVPGMADVFFTALPHGESQETVYTLIKKGKKVVDLSADYRYLSTNLYQNTYGLKHKYPELNSTAVYGIPELNRDIIKKSDLTANPGCYPTCSILGAAPLLGKGIIDESSIIIDAKSGVSGAGRKESLAYSFCECTENFYAYKVASHRHASEIEEQFGVLARQEMTISFVPHLIPVKRGMIATIYAKLLKSSDINDILNIYRDFYKDEYFIRVLEHGIFPETKNVARSNFADIGLGIDTRAGRIIIVSAIDNLGKGASGQAVQNMNIMCGLDEKTGLERPGAYL